MNEFQRAMRDRRRECAYCNKVKTFIYTRTNKRGDRVFSDYYGSPWCGRECPDCRKKRDSKRFNRIDDVTAPHLKKARRSERAVEKYLKLLGMRDIKLTTAHGPDITFTDLEGNVKTCEVKTVLKDPNGRSYFTASVTKKRIIDDYFAAIFPNGEMLMQSMSLHLKQASKCGRRTFTTEMIHDGQET